MAHAPVELGFDVAGSGPLVVLIHGITENRHSWDPIDLTGDFTVLRVDMRGHGESLKAEPYDPATLAADVAGVVEREFPGRVPIVIGHSMGGIVATAYGAAYPTRAIVNVDQSLHLGGMQAQVAPAAPLLRGDGFDQFLGAMFGQLYGALQADEVTRISALRSPDQGVVLRMWSPLLDLTIDEVTALVDDMLAGIGSTPYLVINGIDLGPDYATWLEGKLGNATIEVWAPPTHYPHLVNPARFVDRIGALEASLES